MALDQTIEGIKKIITAGGLPNEYAVTTGAVLPMLMALDWPGHNPTVVYPQYNVQGKFVDFALCNSNSGSPVAFIEVKRGGGLSPRGEEQLFDYAFKAGVPLLVLTDGQKWEIYLPAGQGTYTERKVRSLDILADDVAFCSHYLTRYLSHGVVQRNAALQNAWDDYRENVQLRRIDEVLPRAWNQLLEEPDDMLVDLLAERVEALCDFEPNRQQCIDFISKVTRTAETFSTPPAGTFQAPPPKTVQLPKASPDGNRHGYGFVLFDEWFPCNTVVRVMIGLFEKMAERDPTFPERFAERDTRVRRQYISKDRQGLYPGRPDFASQFAVQSSFGWFIGTHYGRQQVQKAVMLACQVSGLQYGSDVVIHL